MDREIPSQIKKQKRNRQILQIAGIALGVIVMIIAIKVFMQDSISIKSHRTGTVDTGDLEITVNALGKAAPLTEITIVSPINSRILEVYRNPGDILQQGDPILKLELLSVETGYRQKLDEREIKRSKLMQTNIQLQNSLSEMQTQSEIKEMNLRQLHTVLQNERYLDSIGASTTEKVRQAELDYEVTRLELEQLKEKIRNQQQDAAAQLNIEQLELSIFEKSLSESARLLEDARILSPQRATLTFIHNQIGAQVAEGTQIAVVSDLDHFKIEAEIGDAYADNLSLGAKAIIKAGNMEIPGTVVNITPSVSNGIMQFTVLPEDTGHPQLRSGLRTQIYIQYGIEQNTLRIPYESFYIGRGDYDLWVVSGSRAEKRKVRLGECNHEYIQVLSGLQENEQVILSDMSAFTSKNTIKIK